MSHRMTLPKTLPVLLLAAPMMVIGFPHAGMGQQPILHWTFDEATGSLTDDAVDIGSGVPAPGEFQATATRVADTPNNSSLFALDLTEFGLDSWVNGGDAAKVDLLGQFTLTTWVRLKGWNADEDGGGSANQRLLAKQAGNATFDGFSWNINPARGGDESGPDNFAMGLFVGGLGLDAETPTFGFSFSNEDTGADDEWTFLAVSYDGLAEDPVDNTIFYVGDEDDVVAMLGDPGTIEAGPTAPTAGRATLNIGMTDAAPGNDFSILGFQDDVRIYDTVLTMEQLDVVRRENLEAILEGDFDLDGDLDAVDIDQLSAAVLSGQNDAAFDLNGDAVVDGADRDRWVQELKGTWYGDSNLDGEFGTADLVGAFTVGTYETGAPAGWAEGDWDGNQLFESADLVTAFIDGGFELGPRAATSAVPEPTSGLLLWAAIAGVCLRRLRR